MKIRINIKPGRASNSASTPSKPLMKTLKDTDARATICPGRPVDTSTDLATPLVKTLNETVAICVKAGGESIAASYYILLEDGTGFMPLEDGSGFLLLGEAI